MSGETETSGAPSKAPKKSGRSQSPRAVERRRLQNRIAQRNHRRRIKETSVPESAGTSEPGDKQHMFVASTASEVQPQTGHDTAATLCQTSSSPEAMDASIMADDMTGKFNPAWPPFDPLLFQFPNGDALQNQHPASQFFAPKPGCTCNGVTGPCARHLEEIRSQVINRSATAPGPQTRRSGRRDGSTSGGSMEQARYPGGLSTSGNDSWSSPDADRNSTGPSRSGASSSLPSLDESPRMVSMSAFDAGSSSSASSYVEADRANHTATDTARFKTILEAARTAGFRDFDQMVAAYYTTTFEKGSLPQIAQRASRSRRLQKVLQELQEGSKRWPKWESRKLSEGIMENAATVCVEELDRLAGTPELTNLSQNDQAMALDSEREGAGRPTLAFARDSGLQMDSGIQEEAPHLWTLLTELAGPQGLHCDQVAQTIMGALLDARRDA